MKVHYMLRITWGKFRPRCGAPADNCMMTSYPVDVTCKRCKAILRKGKHL